MDGFLGKIFGQGAGSNGSGGEGFIGASLKELRAKHDFFRFFNFEPAGVEKTYPDGDEVLLFKPSGEAFRELVTLHTWVTRGDIIRTIRLSVQRSFIDDAKTCVYAADVYNSFLRSAGRVRAGDPIDAFAHEITARSMQRSAQPVLTRGPVPEAKGAPTPAYRAYAGEAEAENLTYSSGRLRLVARNGGGEFEILVWALDEEDKKKEQRDSREDDTTDTPKVRKIMPSFWFPGNALEAVNLYVSIFPNSRVVRIDYNGPGTLGMQGEVASVRFELDGQPFLAINGDQRIEFSDAFWLTVPCATQAEIDHFWEKLSEGGAERYRGWLKDKYGLSWQIVPAGLDELLGDPDPQKAGRVLRAMLEMKKLDMAQLLAAHRGN